MKIQLSKLIKERNLDRNQLAPVLFPTAKHPRMSVTRLLSGKSKLTEEQIYRLSIFTGLSIDALYEQTLCWKQHTHKGLVRFTTDSYSAIYSPSTGITKVYHLSSLIATHTISSPHQTIEQYLSALNDIIVSKQVQQ
jgi:hypothetical protein